MEFAIHTPVMVESVAGFLLRGSGVYVDATLGTGGHSLYLLASSQGANGSGARVRLIGIDRDPAALSVARERLATFKDRITLVEGNFREIAKIVSGHACDGFFLDCGISTLQLEDRRRGFSYLRDGPLEMSMGADARSVRRLLACAGEREIAIILREFGEERRCRAIARAIARAESVQAITSTYRLRDVVAKVVPAGNLMPSLSRVFQALRIWANEELECLQEFLTQSVDLLKPGGRLVVISYHSLEDRIVKRFFRQQEKGCVCPPGFPQCRCGQVPKLRILTKRPVIASKAEVERNTRARSAKLRVAERL